MFKTAAAQSSTGIRDGSIGAEAGKAWNEKQRQRRQRTESGDGGRDIGTDTGVLDREGRYRGGREQKVAMSKETWN